MKNKGYTLLELLGVIVILSVLVILVFPSVINFVKKSNDEKDNITNDLIISAAEDYIKDNSTNLYLTSGVEYCISIDTLIGKKYLTDIVEDSKYDLKSVKVTYDEKNNYEIVDSKDCSVCKLISGIYNKVGSKYQCKVKDDMENGFKDGYYFYLLSSNPDSTVNLIMERNIYYDNVNDIGMVATETNDGLVAWYDNGEYNSYGPVTAMDYLYNATKDWNNIPNIKIDYQDEGDSGYGKLLTTDDITQITKKDGTVVKVLEDQEGYLNLKARMPSYNEVHGEDKCLTYVENSSENGSCPFWLVNYLNDSDYYKGLEIQNINGVYGYWTLASESTYAMQVHKDGILDHLGAGNSSVGVRPVITVDNRYILN